MTLDASTVQATYDRALTRLERAAAKVSALEAQFEAAFREFDAAHLALNDAQADMWSVGLLLDRMTHNGAQDHKFKRRHLQSLPTRAWLRAQKRAEAELEDETTD